MTTLNAQLVSNDARNRALRTFLQGLAIDLAVAVAAFTLANVDSITDKAGLILALTSLAKTLVTTVASYVMRRFLDSSSFPTPLPPSDPGEPDETPQPILGKAIAGDLPPTTEKPGGMRVSGASSGGVCVRANGVFCEMHQTYHSR